MKKNKREEIIAMSYTGYRGELLSKRKWEEDMSGGFQLDFLPDTAENDVVDIITCPQNGERFI